jgi:transposase
MRGLTPEKRKSIVHKWSTVSGISLRKLAKEEDVSVGAVRTAIKKYGEQCTFEDAPRSGRKSGPVSPAIDKKVRDAYKQKPSASVRDVARKVRTQDVPEAEKNLKGTQIKPLLSNQEPGNCMIQYFAKVLGALSWTMKRM